MAGQEEPRNLIDGLTEEEIQEASGYVASLLYAQKETAKRLKISDGEMKDILNGDREVSHIVYKRSWPNRRHIVAQTLKTSGIAVMAVLLLLCFFLRGFAEGVRITLLNTFIRPQSTRVETVVYDDDKEELTGVVLPADLLAGYRFTTHTRPTGSDMVHAVYTNGRGEKINYYYYPSGATASYDNEYSNAYTLSFPRGTLHVVRPDAGNTIVYFLFDTAYIEIDFEANVSDDDLIRIANGVRRMD